MGKVRKINDEYIIEFYARGLLYQQKAGRDKNAAQKLLTDIEEKINKGELDAADRDVDFDIFINTFCAYAKDRFSDTSFNRFQEVVSRFENFINGEFGQSPKLSKVTPIIIEKFQQFLMKELDPKACNFNLVLVSEMMEYAIKLAYLNDNPVLHTKMIKVQEGKKPVVISEDELGIIKGRADKDMRRMIVFLVHTGLRIEEAFALEWKNVDFEQKRLTIYSEKGRNVSGDQRMVPIESDIIDLLKTLKQIRGEPGKVFDIISADALKKEVDTFLNECPINPKITFNSLRHTFARNLLNRGVSLLRLCEYMGIDDCLQIMCYACYVPQKLLRDQ